MIRFYTRSPRPYGSRDEGFLRLCEQASSTNGRHIYNATAACNDRRHHHNQVTRIQDQFQPCKLEIIKYDALIIFSKEIPQRHRPLLHLFLRVYQSHEHQKV